MSRAQGKTFIADYYRFYDQPRNPPAWMVLELLSFGTLHKLFHLFVDAKPRLAIANHFNVALRVFDSWMHSINFVRNKCAHHDRLWDIAMKSMLSNQRGHAGYWLTEPNVTAINTKGWCRSATRPALARKRCACSTSTTSSASACTASTWGSRWGGTRKSCGWSYKHG
ncbi:Abi family protein [Hymenobacter profundi]|uniref:Abi family protein n=1 Tax=Hymenobacter profundi TaxID=1982110 RepID=A0ABS6WUH6_9BACT|nr:Abi family protein [Hymenobacter profundi]